MRYNIFNIYYMNDKLYYYATKYDLKKILFSNTIMKCEFKSNNKKFIIVNDSKEIIEEYYKPYIDIIIELDRNKLKQKYEIEIDKNYKYIIYDDIENIYNYILSINFLNESIFDSDISKFINNIIEKNIKIYVNGKFKF